MRNCTVFILLLASAWPCESKPLAEFAEKFKACEESILKKWRPHKALSSNDQGGLFDLCDKYDCSFQLSLVSKVEADFAITMGNLGIWPNSIDSYECGNFIALVQEKEGPGSNFEGGFEENIINVLHKALINNIYLKKVIPRYFVVIHRGDGSTVFLSKSAVENAKFLPNLHELNHDQIEKTLVEQIVELTKFLATSSKQTDKLKNDYSTSKYKTLLLKYYISMAEVPKYDKFFQDDIARKRIAKLLWEKIPK